MIDPEAVIDQIREAFADTALPPHVALINNHCCECADVSAAFAGKRWTEVTLDDLAPPVDGHGVPAWFAQRAPGFSAEQRGAIAAFLDWSRERAEEAWPPGTVPPHVYNALKYWSRPE